MQPLRYRWPGMPVRLRFHEQLAAYLRRADLAAMAFAERVRVSQPTMSRIAAGMRPPPPDDLERWASVLALVDAERDAFIEAGILANMPRQGVELVERLEADYAALSKRYDALEAAVTRLERRDRDAPAPRRAPRGRSSGR